MSQLALEARQAAAGARLQLARAQTPLVELARRLRLGDRPPRFVATCARGSSDHAATFGKYVIETTLGCLVASIGPSVVSQYGRELTLDGAIVVAVSQSGRSPDVIEVAARARQRGALVVGLVNDEASPLAHACDVVIPLCAGEERGIAATKSCLLACLAFVQLAAAWGDDAGLRDAASRTPDALDAACALDWDLASLTTASRLYVLGRGVGLGAAFELALKLKETCRLHAEGFSTAKLQHGPIALVEPGFPVIALGQPDETAPATRDLVAHLIRLGASVASTLDVDGADRLPTVAGVPAVISPLCQLQTAYLALPALAALRGLDADRPPNIVKITETR